MSKTAIISDIHGSWEQLERLLTLTEVSIAGAKNLDMRCIFIGDIADLGRMANYADDLTTVEMAAEVGDDFIIGNHEWPWVFPFIGTSFGGMRNKMFEPELEKALCSISWQFATDSHGFLITHAGLDNRWEATNSVDPAQIADDIGDTAARMIIGGSRMSGPINKAPVISAVGYERGGNSRFGGILWADERTFHTIPKVPQIIGHSFIGLTHKQKGHDWFIDTGKGNPSAIILDDDGSIEHVYVDNAERPKGWN
jgi:hypothetical protein